MVRNLVVGKVTLSPTRHLERNEMESKDLLCTNSSENKTAILVQCELHEVDFASKHAGNVITFLTKSSSKPRFFLSP